MTSKNVTEWNNRLKVHHFNVEVKDKFRQAQAVKACVEFLRKNFKSVSRNLWWATIQKYSNKGFLTICEISLKSRDKNWVDLISSIDGV